MGTHATPRSVEPALRAARCVALRLRADRGMPEHDLLGPRQSEALDDRRDSRAVLPSSQLCRSDIGEALRPITASERIEALDVVRGFALVGIFLMNVEF